MKQLLRVGIFLSLLLVTGWAWSQTVTGVVRSSGEPLPGVTIVVKGTSSGTVTDVDGTYKIEANAKAFWSSVISGMSPKKF